MEFEVATEKVEEGHLAQKYGAQRIELCSALDLGGLTPSIGTIEQCAKELILEVHCMIRPRPGNFVYNKDEIRIMQADIEASHNAGAKGVVFGILTTENSIDLENTQRLVQLAKSFELEVTFHRAFDFSPDMRIALKQLFDLGVDRILTSGQKSTVSEGMENIKKLVKWADRKVQIMAGSGVNRNNLNQLISTEVDAVHFTLRTKGNQNDPLNMGQDTQTDLSKLIDLSKIIRNA